MVKLGYATMTDATPFRAERTVLFIISPSDATSWATWSTDFFMLSSTPRCSAGQAWWYSWQWQAMAAALMLCPTAAELNHRLHQLV